MEEEGKSFEFAYRRLSASSGVWFGPKPHTSFERQCDFFSLLIQAGLMAAIAWAIAFGISHIFTKNLEMNYLVARYAATLFFLLRIFLPYAQLVWSAIRNRQMPNFHGWKNFTSTEKSTANLGIAFLIVFALNDFYGFAVKQAYIKPLPFVSKTVEKKVTLPLKNTHHAHNRHHFITDDETAGTSNRVKTISLTNTAGLVLILSLWFLLYVMTTALEERSSEEAKLKGNQKFGKKGHLSTKKKTLIENLPFGLWLGESTGRLSELSHGVGIARKQQVALFQDDAAQNILILGAIGAGKTTRAVHPLLLQLFEQDCGGLIFDIKGDFGHSVESLSQRSKRAYTVIGVTEKPFNLLDGLSPEIAASFLKSTFLLSGGNGRQDSFWVESATELCRHVLGMLSFTPENYSLNGLYRYLFDKSSEAEFNVSLNEALSTLDEPQRRLFASYKNYYENIFSRFDEKLQSGVKATVAQVLSPFNHPELVDAFCTVREDGARLEDVLNGRVFLVNMPLSRWGLGGKVVYTFIKLRFFNLMQQRVSQPHWNQDRFVFLLCDEYQEIVSANKEGLSDLSFWDKSRSSKTVGIISTQSISSFYAAIGERDMANALLQNFRQKICFRTEDEATINFINRLLGTVEIQRITRTETSGSSSAGILQPTNSHSGQSTSISTQQKQLLDGQFFRTLPAGCALAILSLNGHGVDDVLKMEAIYP